MKNTMKQTPEPRTVAEFCRDMGWKYCYMKGVKSFAPKCNQYRLPVHWLLKKCPKFDAPPEGYVTIHDAEVAWGASLRDWALFHWENNESKNRYYVKVCLLDGQPMLLLRESALRKHFGAPQWVSTKQVADKYKLSWSTVYNRLRCSACRRKSVRRWICGYHMLFNAEDVASEEQIWRTYGRCSNVLHCGRRLKEFDSNDEISRSQWRQKLRK